MIALMNLEVDQFETQRAVDAAIDDVVDDLLIALPDELPTNVVVAALRRLADKLDKPGGSLGSEVGS